MILSNGTIASTGISGLGDQTAAYSSTSFHGVGSMPLGGMWAAYGEIYRAQLWVGVVVRKLAMATARNPFDLKRQLGGNDQEPEVGALAELMKKPNERLSGFELWLWTSSTYDIYGEAFWLKLRDRTDTVRELHPIHPTNLVTHRNEAGDIEYLYGPNRLPIPERDVVVFKNYNPENTRRGLSNLEGLRMTLLNEDASRRATASWWQKGARPSVILRHPKNLSDPAIERLKSQMDSNHSGADNMGRTLVLEEAMEATVVQLSAEEMQYIESRKLNREEVCAAYDVPPPAVHILDKATFSNITEQLRSMYRDTMAPRFELFESVVDHQLVPEFHPEGDVFSKFNMDEVLRGDFETRAEAVNKLITGGVMKPSEARPMFNLTVAGPEADQLYGNAALVPLGSTAAAPQQIDTNGMVMPRALGALKSTPALTVRSVMGRLAQVKADKPATRAKLVEEHTKEIRAFFTEQRDSVVAAASSKAAALFDAAAWDEPLADLLTTLGAATSQATGSAVAAELGGKYDAAPATEWVTASATESAKNINRATADAINDAVAAAEDEDADLASWLGETFDGPIAARADSVALSRVAVVAGFATLLAGKQSGGVSKTWGVNSRNPRSAHAAMAGETVGIDETFSNGMNAPGDPAGGADEVAGCTCDLTINLEG